MSTRVVEDGRGKSVTTSIPALTDALTILTRIPAAHRDKTFAVSLAARDSRRLSQSQTFWIFKLAEDQLAREKPPEERSGPPSFGNVKSVVDFLAPVSVRKTGACVTFRNNMPGNGMSNNGTVQIKSSSGYMWKGHFWISNGGNGSKDAPEPELPPVEEGVYESPVTNEHGTLVYWRVAFDGRRTTPLWDNELAAKWHLEELKSGAARPEYLEAPNILYGRIDPEGNVWGHNGKVPPVGVLAMLDTFAEDPKNFVRQFGVKTGRCCFCDLPLTDEISQKWGYGPRCAVVYHLPHGKMKLRALEAAASE